MTITFRSLDECSFAIRVDGVYYPGSVQGSGSRWSYTHNGTTVGPFRSRKRAAVALAGVEDDDWTEVDSSRYYCETGQAHPDEDPDDESTWTPASWRYGSESAGTYHCDGCKTLIQEGKL